MCAKEELMNNVDQFIGNHFSEAMSIAAICSDYGLSRDDARLLTYIHVKCKSNPAGIEYFNTIQNEEVSALEIMLGLRSFSSIIATKSLGRHALDNFSKQVSDGIKNIDFSTQEGCGLELYFRSELVRRLKFHTDETYRNEMLSVYNKTILPKIKAYNGKKIFEAFEKHRKEANVEELKLSDLLN
jgi:hypothetical protein